MSSPPTATEASPALLPLLFPYILSTLHKATHLTLLLYKNLFTFLTFLSKTTLLSPLSYILAPLLTFTSIVFSLTFRVPYSFVSWFLDAVFPLYVFCGVACIVGGLLGYCGRLISRNMIKAVTEEYTEVYTSEDMKKEEDVVERSAKRRKVDRDSGRIKFEDL
ncbi:hypothetical protein AGABI2DRAFT_210160 [Agaricus bisporus var. bisporus H97]|uniref:hypothetical protein n=1 Tax=Agaricus bisporus var. bisporus (strain H97 / ATCC MYA-4626 / FGSC 10389) TaxID=936046 RepID=UPI00029F64A4|nr:hypothetical protein AGABI2DRAFT_210160 [Agaricus bisporus var. bisporus H97]EKV43453.1 hypothetical protein AGABI2DRAFT_210160 [Agaricus bisporus var. bisporus H97]